MRTKTLTETHSRLGLEKVISDVDQLLVRLGYSRKTIVGYRRIWQRLLRFTGRKELTPELAVRFLGSDDCPQNAFHLSAQGAVNILLRYQRGDPMILEQRKICALSGPFKKVHEDYASHLAKFYRCVYSTGRNRLAYAKRFLLFMSDHLGLQLGQLEAKHLSEYRLGPSRARRRDCAP